MTAIDISETFVRYAASAGMEGEKGRRGVNPRPTEKPSGPDYLEHASRAQGDSAPPKTPETPAIDYLVASAVELPFRDESFDFATA